MKGEIIMKNNYNSPEIELLFVEAADVITTSDPTLGTETPPTEAGGGSWEVL